MNKKILIIPDVHGRTFWRAALETGNYEKVIFLGDYVDPYVYEGIDPLQALSNFKDILSLKIIYQDRVILLLGNHDLSYYSDHFHNIVGSDRYDYKNEEELQHLFRGWRRFFKLAHEETIGSKRYLFSHAGVTMSWLKQNKDVIVKPDATHLNHLLDNKEGIDALAQVGFTRYGLYPSGSMVWADIEELLESNPLPDTYQIVGHTMQMDGPIITDKVACLDCRAGFSLNKKGEILPVTEVTPYEVTW